MTITQRDGDRASRIAANLPYLRRYARALTGSQESGDRYAAATLEAILADSSALDGVPDDKTALFRVLHSIWQASKVAPDQVGGGLQAAAQKHLAHLTDDTREALLLHTIEEFDYDQVAAIMRVEPAEARELVTIARREMAESVAGRVLIIEDEPVIAMDLENLVSELGHQITGVARTRDEAVRIGSADRPDLILADIRLADASSGIDAVNDLLKEFGALPVIFITAFPERLLTGERPEPAFLISKPYKEDQVRSAVSQAMFFSSTETLHGA
ncbi:response regulator [Jannaschia seohaensis]|uniref:CheY chemotaxis protein or a CheY-like REC (Receiver) domain n=1 Tax=Jannaschia seohaensis TaxID=475081 RepID=A0A2Y9A251_9RHOB|nr:response regulator [Jannaschia seohaensis]PWJ22057.1 CheY-like chemotaxis protein [Jannaschia seohaensis]SSA38335.1 CheY chemotaxis protein or a CheY-like REC (receiver) domain [Jannaschia seohaensis]